MERAFVEVTKTEEGRRLYGDPDRGATLAQAWRTNFLVAGIDSVCLAVDDLADTSAHEISRLVQFPRDQVVDLLTQAFSAGDGDSQPGQADQSGNAATVYESDGRTGHAVTVMGWDSRQNRFRFHDPWPGDSLLAAGNNVAGVEARQEPDGEWSISRDELQKVIVAAFLFPSTWADLTGNPSQQSYRDLPQSEFFSFFRIRETKTRQLNSVQREISLKPGAFQEHIDLTLVVNRRDRVQDAQLQMRHSWTIGPEVGVNPFGLDLAKSFLLTFTPPQDHDDVMPIAEALWALRDLQAMRKTLQDPDYADTAPGRFIAAYFGGAAAGVALNYCRLDAHVEPRGDEPWLNLSFTIL
jgi:hypothetical protein